MKDVSLGQIFATDKEIYDLIMASPKRLTAGMLLDLASDRRIFCSSQDSREELASFLSGLHHDYHDIAGLMQKGEHGRRAERTTFVEIDSELTPAEIKSAVVAYQQIVNRTEVISVPTSTVARTRVNLEYDEIDYSRTRLIQKQRRQAEIDFAVKDGKTRIRMPATEKARSVVKVLKEKIASGRATSLEADEISVSDLINARDRNAFFMNLIKEITGYRLEMVTDAKVARNVIEKEDDQDDEVAAEEAQRELISVVNSVSMRGVNIILTQEYQKFLEQGFLLTAITWRAIQIEDPGDLVQFEVAFEDGIGGSRFRYAVRYSPMLASGKHAKSFQSVPEARKPSLFSLIEDSARKVLTAVRSEKLVKKQSSTEDLK